MAVQDGGREDPGQAAKARYLAKCVLHSSVVLQAVYGHIRSPTTCDIVFGKETSLELVVVSEDGIVQSVCDQPVFGTIKDLRVLPWNEHHRSHHPQTYGKDLLVLLSDSGKLTFLTFSIDLHRFLAVSQVHLTHPGNQRRELGRVLAVESRGRAVAVAAFEDRLAIFPTSAAAGNSVVDKRMVYPREPMASVGSSEASTSGLGEKSTGWGTIWSMAFVGTADDVCASMTSKGASSLLLLAVLVHRKGAASNELQILTCDPKERIIQLTSRYDPAATCTWVVAPPLGLAILDVPAAPGFILLSWTGGFLLLDLRTPNSPQKAAVYRFQRNLDDEEGSLNSVAASALLQLNSQGRDSACKENSISERESFVDAMDVDRNLSLSSPTITAWSWEPDAPAGLRRSQLALAMDTGEIHIAQFSLESSDGLPRVEVRQRQYKCSPCNVVLWLKGGFLTVFVDMGDGHVLQSMADGTLTCCSQVQNLTPILDFALVDYHGEKQDQMFACCGAGKEGTLRVIHNGISVEKLHTTPPVYQGVTGMYVMRMCRKDLYHAFFVMSFVQETRVLSVGLNFVDITDAVGFQSWSSTLACGNIEDGFVAQVCSKEVCVCAPTVAAHPAGINMSLPLCSSWKPPGALFICLGAVAHKMIIVALSQPGLIVMLGTQHSGQAAGQLELFEIQRCLLEAELSCISIPEEENLSSSPLPPSIVGLVEDSPRGQNPPGIEAGKVCVVGTHKPSVMLLSIIHGKNFAPLAVGLIPLMSYMGTTLSGCVPESVRLAQFDRLYILAGLRNGVLLRYEWPSSSPLTGMPLSFLQLTSGKHECGEQFIAKDSSSSRDEAAGKEDSLPVALHLVAVRRIGVSPVSLVSLQDSLRADIVALSDRPWLLQTARHSQRIAYTSISFPPSTHATPVSSFDCPNGILFVADCSLHLVEMERLKRLNVQRLPVGRTPRRVLYHSESKTLLVMRSDSSGPNRSAASDICCMDPLSGVIHSCFQLEAGETARCMHLWKVGNEQLLLVGTSLTSSNLITTAGEAESSKGRLLVFYLEPKSRQSSRSSTETRSSNRPPPPGSSSEDAMQASNVATTSADESDLTEGEGQELRLKTRAVVLPGAVLTVATYLGQYILTSAGNYLFCFGFLHDSPQRLRKFAMVRTRFMITSLAVHLTRIAVGDCHDGVLFYYYQEDTHQLEQLYCDPVHRLVADCVLMDNDTAVASDRHGNFCVLSCTNIPEESVSPERNLTLSCSYHVGEAIMRICKASLAYDSTMDDNQKAYSGRKSGLHCPNSSVVATSLLGSVFIFIQLSREEYELLEAVQGQLAVYPLTAPLLGNNHADFRGRGCPSGVSSVLDGDMLCQFLELTSMQQESVLTEPQGIASVGFSAATSLSSLSSSSSSSLSASGRSLPVDRVLRLLERIHNSLA